MIKLIGKKIFTILCSNILLISTYDLIYHRYGSTAAASASVPPGPESKCEQIKDGCYTKWVYKDNQSKDCAKEDIPLIPTPSASH